MAALGLPGATAVQDDDAGLSRSCEFQDRRIYFGARKLAGWAAFIARAIFGSMG